MENELQELPISVQSFKKLRKNNYLYVDKTKEILNLVKTEKSYFLSRPRRFGKSLLVSTIENIFLGNKGLFEDLYIYEKWDWDKNYPIIRIDLGGNLLRSGADLKNFLSAILEEIAESYDVGLKYENIGNKFRELIKKLHEKHEKGVVVLIDEYDKPILDKISYFDVRDEMKEILHDFYQILKGQDGNLKFVLLTGVSKFVGTSIFSGLNSPVDITLSKKFSTICGYTQKELEYNFHGHIPILCEEYSVDKETILKTIKQWYNGYSWDGKNFVYNPQSILSLFEDLSFSNYWFKTGTPTFLINMLKERNGLNRLLSNLDAGSEISDSYDPENIPIIPLMFQSGYLTIKKIIIVGFESNYLLNIPNREVKDSLLKYLLNSYIDYPLNDVSSLRNRMRKNFLNKDNNGLNLNLREMIAEIPYNLHGDNESYYHTVFLLWLNLLDFRIDGEVVTDKGRIDAVIIIENEAIVVEIKFGKDKNKIDDLVSDALNQINDKKYYEKYLKYNTSFLGIAYADKEVKCRFLSNF